MIVSEIKAEIVEQMASITYLRDHPEIAEHTIMHETPEYCRGALNMLKYLKEYIVHLEEQ